MRRSTPLLPALAAGLALTGCGQRTDGPPAGPRPTAADDPALQPLDAYDVSDADNRTIGRARWALAKTCMLRLGFDRIGTLDVDPPPAWPRPPERPGVVGSILYLSVGLRYGVQDPKQTAEYGYRSAAALSGRMPDRTWSLDEYLALTGQFLGEEPKSVHGHRVPHRGCLGEANRRIFGSDPEDRRDPVLELEGRSITPGMKDPAWKEADRKWSACMKAVGHHYATPKDAEAGAQAPRQELGERRDPDEPSARERETAVADARCKQQTGYVRSVHAVDVRIQRRLVAEHRTKLEEQRRWNLDAARTARTIVEHQG
ncbi:hypothetical protein ABZV31_06575 [Streptomyces sp. NPDC005202]|uniref:hypothetical protein n=1 Tax=Streptomyces sp. NPDC005202 TaxID=3157021 RepID=UPI0033BB06B2